MENPNLYNSGTGLSIFEDTNLGVVSIDELTITNSLVLPGGATLPTDLTTLQNWQSDFNEKTDTYILTKSGTSTFGETPNNSSNWDSAYTDTSNATSTNTANTIVKRDGSGNFSANLITASLAGNASSATQIYTANDTADTTSYLAFVNNVPGIFGTIQTLKTNSSIGYDASNNTISATLSGTATQVSNDLSVDDSSLQLDTGTAYNGSSAKTISIKALGVTNGMLAGSIENSKLLNSTISGISLGSNLNDLSVDDSSLQLDTGTAYNGNIAKTISIKALGVTNGMLAGSIENSKLLNSTISGISLGSNLNNLTAGSYFTALSQSQTYNGSTARTWNIDGSTSGVSNLVARDSSGNFSAGVIAAFFNGSYNLASASATTGYLLWADGTSGFEPIRAQAGLQYNTATNSITANYFIGSLTGNADTATLATNATNATNASNVLLASGATDASHYIPFSTTATGNSALLTDSVFTYNPFQNNLSITGGSLTIQDINASGNISINNAGYLYTDKLDAYTTLGGKVITCEADQFKLTTLSAKVIAPIAEFDKDGDNKQYLGRAILNGGSDEVFLTHYDYDASISTNHILKGIASGDTYLNCSSGRSIVFSEAAGGKMLLKSGLLGINCNPTTTGCMLDVDYDASRTGTSPSNLAGYFTKNTAGNILEIRHENQSQGIGFGYNTISATGSNANQDLYLEGRGTGKIYISNTSGNGCDIKGTLEADTANLRGNVLIGDGTTAEQDILWSASGGNTFENGVNSSAPGAQWYVYGGAGYSITSLRSNGNVGIKKTNASYALDVNGSIYCSGSYLPFTGSHIYQLDENVDITKLKNGMVMSSTGKLHINPIPKPVEQDKDSKKTPYQPEQKEAEPIIKICDKEKDKAVVGVFVKLEGEKALINALGDGFILVCTKKENIKNIEAGDFLCSSSLNGYAELQDNEFQARYTIAKSNQDIIFNEDSEIIIFNNIEYYISICQCSYRC